MITPDYVRTMAAYNAEMNRRLYDAAARLSDAERKQERGAFWSSIHGTLNHLLWGDLQWMVRFDGWQRPAQTMKESPTMHDDFAVLAAERQTADEKLIGWAKRVDQGWLDQEQVWHSISANRELRQPRALLVMHLFNHQTHHRGQAHAMITAAGQQTGDTDLTLIV
jgi:uncharacterized damage-inducible protein DinB